MKRNGWNKGNRKDNLPKNNDTLNLSGKDLCFLRNPPNAFGIKNLILSKNSLLSLKDIDLW